MKEGTKLYSVTHLKCPKCQQGNLFSVPDSYHLGKVLDMPDKCPIC